MNNAAKQTLGIKVLPGLSARMATLTVVLFKEEDMDRQKRFAVYSVIGCH